MATLVIETKPCPMCGGVKFLEVKDTEWNKFNSPSRPSVQECFPNMPAGDREMLVSGTCPTCWDKMFAF